MKNYLKTILVCCVVGAITMTGETTAQNIANNAIYVLPNATISIDQKVESDLDFSKLYPGIHAFLELFDAQGSPYTLKIERKENLKLAVSANTSALGNIKPNTTLNFYGKGKLYRSVNLTELQSQRCGLWCVIANICCVHIHLGPPGNSWEWSCSNCSGVE